MSVAITPEQTIHVIAAMFFERLIADISSGNPPDLAWNSAMVFLHQSIPNLLATKVTIDHTQVAPTIRNNVVVVVRGSVAIKGDIAEADIIVKGMAPSRVNCHMV